MNTKLRSHVVKWGVVFSACAFLALANNAHAAVQIVLKDANFLPSPVNPDAPDFGAGTQDYVSGGGSLAGVYRSPYQNADGSTYPAGYATAPYYSVQNGSLGYNFDSYNGGAGLLGLGFLWGSPDTYNTLAFYDGINGTGNLLGTFGRTDVVPPGPNDQGGGQAGHVWVGFLSDNGVRFLSVVLTSTQAAFEHYISAVRPDQQIGEVPLPGALVLFGSALAGLTLLGRRRRSLNATATS